MAVLKCHLTDVTVREILKRARFKDFHLFLIHSHCVLEEDTDHLSLFFFLVGLLSARDSEPASVTALNISNRGLVSSMSLKWKSKYRVVFLSSFLLFEDIIKIPAILCVHMYVIEGIFNTPGLK